MPDLKLNETPVRTARNFNINNIKLQNIKYIVEAGDFKNSQINGLDTGADIDDNISISTLKYGLRKRVRRRSRETSK